jgi:hypothetical protein
MWVMIQMVFGLDQVDAVESAAVQVFQQQFGLLRLALTPAFRGYGRDGAEPDLHVDHGVPKAVDPLVDAA